MYLLLLSALYSSRAERHVPVRQTFAWMSNESGTPFCPPVGVSSPVVFRGCVCSGADALCINSDVHIALYDHQFSSPKCISEDWHFMIIPCSNAETFQWARGFYFVRCYYSSDKRQSDLQPFQSHSVSWGQCDQNSEQSSCLHYRDKSYLLWRAGHVSRRKPHPHTFPCSLLASLLVLLLVIGFVHDDTQGAAKTGAKVFTLIGQVEMSCPMRGLMSQWSHSKVLKQIQAFNRLEGESSANGNMKGIPESLGWHDLEGRWWQSTATQVRATLPPILMALSGVTRPKALSPQADPSRDIGGLHRMDAPWYHPW